MRSKDLLDAGWQDITGSFAERDRYLELARQGKAAVRRLHNGWFGKVYPCPQRSPAQCLSDNGEGRPSDGQGPIDGLP
jgi:hypothetical protein